MTKVNKQLRSCSGNLRSPWTSFACSHSAVFSPVFDSAVGCQCLFLNRPTPSALSRHPSWCLGQKVVEGSEG